MTYKEASARLEAILEEIEGGQVPLDDLLAYVKEAKQLLAFCKEKLTNIDAELKLMMDE